MERLLKIIIKLMSRKSNSYREIDCCLCGELFSGNHSQAKYCSDVCKQEGARASWRKYGSNNRLKRKIYYNSYYKKNSDSIIARTTAYSQTERGKLAVQRSDANQKIKNPVKIDARQKVGIAIKSGKLVKGLCEVCNSKKVQAHHDDYSKPLIVRWLCITHHVQLHHS